MNNSLAIFILIVLGLVAALSAAVLVGFMRIDPVQQAAEQLSAVKDVDVLVATRNIPAMSLVAPDAVTVKTVPFASAPEGYVSDPVQAIGKFVSIPIIAEQAITRTAFVPEGTGSFLAGHLPEGKRAVSIILAGDSGLAGILYPSCKVDVLATFSLGDDVGTALSTTMYENLEVLAIDAITAAGAQKAAEDEEKQRSQSRTTNLLITLLVDPVQAKGIQLATDYGNVSLAMRNPTDELRDDSDAQILSEGRLARYADFMTDAKSVGGEQVMLAADSVEAPEESSPEMAPPEPRADPVKPEISIAVMRGSETSTVFFPGSPGQS